jgi:hypothetical protein
MEGFPLHPGASGPVFSKEGTKITKVRKTPKGFISELRDLRGEIDFRNQRICVTRDAQGAQKRFSACKGGFETRPLSFNAFRIEVNHGRH